MGRHVACMGNEKYVKYFGRESRDEENVLKTLVLCEDHVKMDHKERMCSVVGSVYLAQEPGF
jgi:hypothetical protein